MNLDDSSLSKIGDVDTIYNNLLVKVESLINMLGVR